VSYHFALAQLALGMQAFIVGATVDAQKTKANPLPIQATVSFGWRAREMILNQGPGGANRIVVIPGDPQSGSAGQFTRGHQVSSNPRTLLTWHKLATLSVWGVDTTGLQDEAKQAAATETLVELAVQALHNAIDPATGDLLGVANITWGSPRWGAPANTNQYFGRELLIPFTQRGPLFDQAFAVTTTAKAVINRDPTITTPFPKGDIP